MKNIILENRNNCPICEGDNTSIYINFPDIQILKCNHCGFLFSGKVMSENYLKLYYENNYGGQKHIRGQQINAKINSWFILKLIKDKKILNINHLLDIGTGYGFLLSELKNKKCKFELTGVELSKQEAIYAKESLNLNVINALLKESSLRTNYFDLVTSFEVIEHIKNPVIFINDVLEYVKPGGYLIIMTDNFDSKMARSLGAAFPKWIPHTHISHFTFETLKNTIKIIEKVELLSSYTYTPWEIRIKNFLHKIMRKSKDPKNFFNLNQTLKSEMNKKYKLFYLRKLLNILWFKATLNQSSTGDLMFFLIRKKES